MSVNVAWQGRRFKTKQYLDYEQKCFILLPKRKRVEGWVRVIYTFGMDTTKSFKLSDIGNFEKPLSDILVKAGYIDDDRYVVEMVLRKKLTNEGNYIQIEIEPLAYNPLV